MSSNALKNVKTLRGDGGPIKIAFIGDSLTTQNALIGEGATAAVERLLNHMGFPCAVTDFGRDGHTFYRANTVTYINGLTSVQATIAHNPNVVVVALGVNDTVGAVDGRTLVQATADAAATFAALRAGLPNAKIMYGSEVPFDAVNFTSATVKNKGMVPGWMTLRATGILTGMFSSEILEDDVASATRLKLADWVTLNTTIKANATIDALFDINLWRISRLGGTGQDSIHLNAGGRILAAGYILKGMRAFTSVFTTLFSNNFDWWEDPDFLFTDILTVSGSGYTYGGELYAEAQDTLNANQLHTQTWYMPLEGICSATPYVENSGSTIFMWSIQGARSGKAVQVSANGGAFTTTTSIVGPRGSAWGIAAGSDTGGFIIGANTLRYAVDNICFDPIEVTYAEPPSRYVNAALLNGWITFAPNTLVPGYAKSKEGMVSLRGTVKGGPSGTASQIMTLPIGYRPVAQCIFPALSNMGMASIQIDPDGKVYVVANTAGVTLDSVFFFVA